MSELLQVASTLRRASSRETEVRVLATVVRVSAGCVRSTVVQSPFVSWSHFQGQRNSDADRGHRLAHRSSTRANIHHLAHRSMTLLGR
jgi:hypothetical protein